MLSQQDNETLVRVGPDTGMGSLFRLFWIPFLPSKDLVADWVKLNCGNYNTVTKKCSGQNF